MKWFLFKRGEKISKRAFWQFMTMTPATAFIWVVVYRFWTLSDADFLTGLTEAGLFLGLIQAIVLFFYHKGGKYGNGNGEGDP